MERADLVYFKHWFERYVAGYYSRDGCGPQAVRLKEDHTKHTCRDIVTVGGELSLAESDLLLAETAALFHDIGRFPQWRRYGTFIDNESEDHAVLGLQELHRHRVLDRIGAADAQVIEQAIRNHNHRELPRDLAGRPLFFAKLLRDADKLDIWRVVIEYRRRNNAAITEALAEGIPDIPSCSPEIVEDLRKGIAPELAQVGNRNDLLLLRLGWVFDLNFAPSCRQVLERQYVEQLISYLPDTPEMRELQGHLVSHLKECIGRNLGMEAGFSCPKRTGRSGR
jgi:hypothetical protein